MNATKKTPRKATAKTPQKAEQSADRTNVAKVALSASANAAVIVSRYGHNLGVTNDDAQTLYETLSRTVTATVAGDMAHMEAMLVSQAHALQAISTRMTMLAADQDLMSHWQAFMSVALKAQNQCRMTIESLSAIKNPPAVFARQANINNGGQQQVNNGVQAPLSRSPSHAQQSISLPNELLEDSTNGRTQLDPRAAATAGRANQNMETVGALDRPANE